MIARAGGVALASLGSAVLMFACSAGDDIILATGSNYGQPPSFPAGDATTTAEEAGLLSYCPSNTCPAGRTTCPDSRFPCDVDLKTDKNNCGECGSVCHADVQGRAMYTCVDGRCVPACNFTWDSLGGWNYLDCDGSPENGCETDPSNDNCGACGKKCTDPAKPCVPAQGPVGIPTCGCPDGQLLCLSPRPHCVDPENDDANCGACGIACDPAGPDGEFYPNGYLGCKQGQCGALKCFPQFVAPTGDCDGDLSNGCETVLTSSEHCGACGNACSGHCAVSPENPFSSPVCNICPPGTTFCALSNFGDAPQGECVDITTDASNCGRCGNSCGLYTFEPTSKGVCTYGSCSRVCFQGRADCNGNAEDDCEVDTDSDPRNCGGCGKVCDKIAGQACVRGQCVVEPCDEDAGEVGAR